jgi:hypothetical protein
LIAIAAVAAVIILIADLSSNSTNSSGSEAPVDTGAAMAEPISTESPETGSYGVDSPLTETSGLDDSKNSDPEPIVAAPAQFDRPVLTPSETYESKPPAGDGNVLSASQIRYCLAEDVRIGAAQKVVDRYDDSQIEKFNNMVNDYNYRCSHFRYRDGTLQLVQSEIAARQSELEAEGAARFR